MNIANGLSQLVALRDLCWMTPCVALGACLAVLGLLWLLERQR